MQHPYLTTLDTTSVCDHFFFTKNFLVHLLLGASSSWRTSSLGLTLFSRIIVGAKFPLVHSYLHHLLLMLTPSCAITFVDQHIFLHHILLGPHSKQILVSHSILHPTSKSISSNIIFFWLVHKNFFWSIDFFLEVGSSKNIFMAYHHKRESLLAHLRDLKSLGA